MKVTVLAIVGVCLGMSISSGLLAFAETLPPAADTGDAFVSAMLDQHHRAATGVR